MSQVDHFRRVSDLFERARSIPPDERDAFLREHCSDDLAIFNEVNRLLEYHADTWEAFDEPVVGSASWQKTKAPSDGDELPQQIGHYLIRRKIGEGGMGVVYLAEQENPRRLVAVKVIRPGFVGRDVLKRFDLEASMLGRLQHPGIAQIHEAGTQDDESGTQPYFAMEYVQGAPLLEYARDRKLDVRSRLETFARICDAVEHAHQRGVIHRDIKPSNVLVDGSGQPKILDFGVARATASDLQISTMHTEVGQLIGTLAYMSPEQVMGRAAEIDTRSDVYALGIVLYELISDRLPYDLGGHTIVTAARVIAEQEPTSLTTVNSRYRGDLDTIAQKALEKEPDRRYQSAAALAADIRHFVNDEPIVARPASTVYQLRKFARRNRGLVAGVATAFVALVAGVIVATTFAIGQTRALAESERQRTIAEAVNDFLNEDLLGKANPYTGAAHDASLRDVLDQAAVAIEDRFLDQPLVHASIRGTLAATFFQLADYEEAERHAVPAIKVLLAEGQNENALQLNKLRHTLVLTRTFDWRLDEAEDVLQELLLAVNENESVRHELAHKAYMNLGIIRKRQNRYDEAEAAYRKAIDILESREPPLERQVAITKLNLSLALYERERYDQAEELLLESITLFEKTTGPDSADVAYSLSNLGHVYRKGQPNEEGYMRALDCFDRALTIRRKQLGPDHTETRRTEMSIGMVEIDRGNHNHAEDVLRSVLNRRQGVIELGEEDIVDLEIMKYVGVAMEGQGRVEEAIPFYRKAWLIAQTDSGTDGRLVSIFRTSLLNALQAQGDDEGKREVYSIFHLALINEAESPSATWQKMNHCAWELLTCEFEDMRDPKRALEFAKRAIAEGGDREPEAHNTLAQAFAANDRLDEAVETQKSAIALLPADASEDRRGRFEDDLRALLVLPPTQE